MGARPARPRGSKARAGTEKGPAPRPRMAGGGTERGPFRGVPAADRPRSGRPGEGQARVVGRARQDLEGEMIVISPRDPPDHGGLARLARLGERQDAVAVGAVALELLGLALMDTFQEKCPASVRFRVMVVSSAGCAVQVPARLPSRVEVGVSAAASSGSQCRSAACPRQPAPAVRHSGQEPPAWPQARPRRRPGAPGATGPRPCRRAASGSRPSTGRSAASTCPCVR